MIEGDPNAHVPSCPIHHVEKRSRHREGHLDGKGPKLKANEAEEGPGATSLTGPQGAKSESLSKGLGL